jgi:hypothetical protein
MISASPVNDLWINVAACELWEPIALYLQALREKVYLECRFNPTVENWQ